MTSKQSRCVVWGTVLHSLMSIVCSYAQLGVEPATRWVDAHRVAGFLISRNACATLAVQGWALSCWNSCREGCCHKNGTSTGWSTSSCYLCPIRFPPRTITSEAALSCKAAGEAQMHMATCSMPQPNLGQHHHTISRGTHNNIVHILFCFVFFLLVWGYMS